MEPVIKYLATVILTAEPGNIWLYTLPEDLMAAFYAVGAYIVSLLGG